MREGGFQGIVKQPRSDLANNKILRAELDAELPSSTLYRHLRIQGATRKLLGVAKETIRCRWTRELPNALWQGDFEHGPTVLGRRANHSQAD